MTKVAYAFIVKVKCCYSFIQVFMGNHDEKISLRLTCNVHQKGI